jgi:membrane protein
LPFSKLLLRSVGSFIKDQGSIFAASMSFFAIMAIVPFLLFLITMMSLLIGEDPEMKNFVVSRILETFPEVTRDITGEISKLVSYSGIGIASFVVYAYLSFKLLKSTEFALNAIFKIPEKRAIHHSILASVSIITFLMLLFIASFSAATIFNTSSFLKPYIPEFEISVITGILIRFIIPFILLWLIITLLYTILPLKRPSLLHSIRAALFVSIVFEAAKHIFSWYVDNMSRLGHIYGPLTASIVFFLWVYYSSCLFLIGAEMITILENSKEDVHVQSYW